ncbi:unnamed protein product [Zymoseptoria tritici ST99CH_1E4]|uniref:Uncharacterized protein n=1 Tax=Zymoseptoria tritici ST99CH_1E4 TaxID=1276532 RepID=A0A2H1H8P9_ZYMTR|nr:unnamed protein product [Zymoseptoria tritici ST99CH_1E4]
MTRHYADASYDLRDVIDEQTLEVDLRGDKLQSHVNIMDPGELEQLETEKGRIFELRDQSKCEMLKFMKKRLNYVDALFVQSRGFPINIPDAFEEYKTCESCLGAKKPGNKRGPLKGPFKVCKNKLGNFDNACANCIFSGNKPGCSVSKTYKAEQARREKDFGPPAPNKYNSGPSHSNF